MAAFATTADEWPSEAHACAAARIAAAPQLSAPDAAQKRLDDWLAELDGQPAARRCGGCSPRIRRCVRSSSVLPTARRISGISPPPIRRGSCALLESDPEARLDALLADTRGGDFCHARRSRCDAAPAPHEGGGVAADRARRHRRRLAGDARHRRAHRARRCRGRRGGAASARRRRRARASFARPTQRSPRPAAATSCWRWARWARASSTIRATST